MEAIDRTVKEAMAGLKQELSAAPLPSQENTIISDNYERDRKERMRLQGANALGGLRAFDTYTVERFIKNAENATAFEAACNFNPRTENLYFFGGTGSGKSHLAAIAARGHIDNRKTIITTNQMNIGRAVRGCASAEQEGYVISKYVTANILAIDDLGVAKDTEWIVSLIYEIINGRYMDLPGGLIVTSNLSLSQLAGKIGDDRVSSRIAQMAKVFNLGDKDHRIGGKS